MWFFVFVLILWSIINHHMDYCLTYKFTIYRNGRHPWCFCYRYNKSVRGRFCTLCCCFHLVSYLWLCIIRLGTKLKTWCLSIRRLGSISKLSPGLQSWVREFLHHSSDRVSLCNAFDLWQWHHMSNRNSQNIWCTGPNCNHLDLC